MRAGLRWKIFQHLDISVSTESELHLSSFLNIFVRRGFNIILCKLNSNPNQA